MYMFMENQGKYKSNFHFFLAQLSARIDQNSMVVVVCFMYYFFLHKSINTIISLLISQKQFAVCWWVFLLLNRAESWVVFIIKLFVTIQKCFYVFNFIVYFPFEIFFCCFYFIFCTNSETWKSKWKAHKKEK